MALNSKENKDVYFCQINKSPADFYNFKRRVLSYGTNEDFDLQKFLSEGLVPNHLAYREYYVSEEHTRLIDHIKIFLSLDPFTKKSAILYNPTTKESEVIPIDKFLAQKGWEL